MVDDKDAVAFTARDEAGGIYLQQFLYAVNVPGDLEHDYYNLTLNVEDGRYANYSTTGPAEVEIDMEFLNGVTLILTGVPKTGTYGGESVKVDAGLDYKGINAGLSLNLKMPGYKVQFVNTASTAGFRLKWNQDPHDDWLGLALSIISPLANIINIATWKWAFKGNTNTSLLFAVPRGTAVQVRSSVHIRWFGLDCPKPIQGGNCTDDGRNTQILHYTPPPAILIGKVSSTKDNMGIALAQVVADVTHRGATNASGNYQITDLGDGDYTVTASATGYQDSVKVMNLESGKTVTCDFGLAPIAASGSSGTGGILQLIIQFILDILDKIFSGSSKSDISSGKNKSLVTLLANLNKLLASKADIGANDKAMGMLEESCAQIAFYCGKRKLDVVTKYRIIRDIEGFKQAIERAKGGKGLTLEDAAIILNAVADMDRVLRAKAKMPVAPIMENAVER